jgi:hypothetical protein
MLCVAELAMRHVKRKNRVENKALVEVILILNFLSSVEVRLCKMRGNITRRS